MVDIRLHGKGNSNSHGAGRSTKIIYMIQWIRTSRLPMKISLWEATRGGAKPPGGGQTEATRDGAKDELQCLFGRYAPTMEATLQRSSTFVDGRASGGH